jgi:hypothetical protein
VHAPAFQVINERQQIAGVASETVQLPDHYLITIPQVIEHLIQLVPVGLASAHAVLL